jgi:hypothetical protein
LLTSSTRRGAGLFVPAFLVHADHEQPADLQDCVATGLSTLRERLQVYYSGAAQLRVTAQEPRGV